PSRKRISGAFARIETMNHPSPALRAPSPPLGGGEGRGEGAVHGKDVREMKIRAFETPNRGKTSNVQHPTPNPEVREDSRCYSMLGVGCSMLNVPPGSWAECKCLRCSTDRSHRWTGRIPVLLCFARKGFRNRSCFKRPC